MASAEFRRSMAEGEAKRIWKLYGLRTPGDLVLEDLALAMGVAVIEAPLDAADARLVRKGPKGLIRVKRDIPQAGRKRFAIAHELGHWRLHERTSQIIACTSDDMRAYKGSEPEVEANWFAAELLMPSILFGTAIRGTTPAPDTINSLANEFGTTRTATAVRYAELSTEPCAVVVAERGRVTWWRASRELEGSLWIPAGAPVSPRTVAGALFAGRTPTTVVQRVGMDAWAERYPDYAADAWEAAMPLGQSGLVLTMLWLD